MISEYEVTDRHVAVKTPYCDSIARTCRAWGGKFDDGRWLLSRSRLPEVQEQLGVDVNDLVEVEVGKDDWDGYAQIRVGWYVLAGRRARDSRADIYAEMVAGFIPLSGGSVKNPAVAAGEGTRFRLWVPRDFAVARSLKVVTDTAVVDPRVTSVTTAGDLPARVAQVRELMDRLGVRLEDLAG